MAMAKIRKWLFSLIVATCLVPIPSAYSLSNFDGKEAIELRDPLQPRDWEQGSSEELREKAPPFLNRVKREDDYYEDSDEDESEPGCKQLPPNLPSQDPFNGSISLMDLLNNGSTFMRDDDDGQVNEAILVLGNTGSGKSTLVQIMAGNLSTFHAVQTQGGGLVIIDDGNRIGTPSTISKTLVPELILNENGTAFYDCPGFDDNRGPEKDIAVNYIINQVIRKVKRVKLLFTVAHSSVTVGINEGLDFDLLASHATKFLKNNMPNYRAAIGLVVTKVESYNDAKKFVKDKSIMKGILQFLNVYLDGLRFKLKTYSDLDPSSAEELQKKVDFVESLLEKNEEGKYGKISFSRGATECGSLSESKVVSETKKRLIRFYSEELEYSPVDPEDFGYTLKMETKLALVNFGGALNKAIKDGIAGVMADFQGWMEEESIDLMERLKKVKSSIVLLEGVKANWTSLSNSSNPEDLMAALESNLLSVGYTVPPNLQQLMKRQNDYFDFFDKVNEAPVSGAFRDWSAPLDDLIAALEEEEAKMKPELRNYVLSLNENVGGGMAILMNDFLDWSNATFLQSSNLSEKFAGVKKVTAELEGVLAHLNILGERNNPEDFMKVMEPAMERLEFEVPRNFTEGMEKCQEYFEYDDVVNAPGVKRAVKEWMAPVAGVAKMLKEIEGRVELELKIWEKDVKIAELAGLVEGLRKQLEAKERELQSKTSANEEQANEMNRLKADGLKCSERNQNVTSELTEVNSQIKLLRRQLSSKTSENEEQANETKRLKAEAMIMCGTSLNITTLHEAAGLQNKSAAVNAIKCLINNGADAFAVDGTNNTFLHVLVGHKVTRLTPSQFHDISAFLISKKLAQLFNAPGNNDTRDIQIGSTPFHLAVENIEIEKVSLSLLRSSGVDFNALDKYSKRSPLFYAVWWGRSTRLLSDLVALGANPKYLNSHMGSLLHYSAVYGTAEQLQFFVNLGLNVNAMDDIDQTPLHKSTWISFSDTLEKVRFLIEKGANVNAKDVLRKSPLDYALGRQDFPDKAKIVQLLRDNQ